MKIVLTIFCILWPSVSVAGLGHGRLHSGGATVQAASGSPPVVQSVTPNGGGPSGGTPVTISGTGFTSASAVTFGGTSASFTFVSDNSITISSAPSGTLNTTVDVLVTTPNGTSSPTSLDKFSYASWKQVFTANSASGADCSSHFMGGTEGRGLITHTFLTGAKLPCGATATASTPAIVFANGYWEDNACSAGQGPQVLLLLSPGGSWAQDFMFPPMSAGCGGSTFNVTNSIMDACFDHDASGTLISPTQCVLVGGGPAAPTLAGSHFYARDDSTGTWTAYSDNSLAHQAIRALAVHDDTSSGTVSTLLLGNDNNTPVSETFTTGAPFTGGTFTSLATEPYAISPFTSAGTCILTGDQTATQSSTNCSNYNTLWPAGNPTSTAGGACTTVIPCTATANVRTLALVDCPTGTGSTKTLFAESGWNLWRRHDASASSFWQPIGVVPWPDTNISSNNGLRGLSCVPFASSPSGFALISTPEAINGSVYRWDTNATLPALTGFSSTASTTTLSWSGSNPFAGALTNTTTFTVTGITGFNIGNNPNTTYNTSYTIDNSTVTDTATSVTIPVAHACDGAASCTGGQINVIPVTEVNLATTLKSDWGISTTPGYGISGYNGRALVALHNSFIFGSGSWNGSSGGLSYYVDGTPANKYGGVGLWVRSSNGATYHNYPKTPGSPNDILSVAAPRLTYNATPSSPGQAFCASPSGGLCAITTSIREAIVSPFASDGNEVIYFVTFDANAAPVHDTTGVFTVPATGGGITIP